MSNKRTQTLIERTGLKLLKFSSTRWAFVYSVMNRMLKIRQELDNLLFDDDEISLANWQWECIEAICSLIAPFFRAITTLEVRILCLLPIRLMFLLQGDYATIARIIPELITLRKWCALPDWKNKRIDSCAIKLSEGLTNKFFYVFDIHNKVC